MTTSSRRRVSTGSMHAYADVHNSMMELTNLQHKTSEQHIELGKNRIKLDYADFKMIELFFEVHNPFDPEEPDVRNLFTRLTTKLTMIKQRR